MLTVSVTEEITTEFVRVEYDLDRAVRGILESELPNDLAEFLKTGGRWTAASPVEG